MATTIRETEAIPASYPATPSGLSTAATAFDSDVVWQRIESYIAHRWTDRQVVWIVSDMGEWCPPLTPATVTATEVWADGAWTTAALDPSPMGGYEIESDGQYRFTADVGSGTVPAAVNQAFVRLVEYMADDGPGPAGATSSSHDVGAISISHDRSASWLARAMQNSGAADLLRPYRKA